MRLTRRAQIAVLVVVVLRATAGLATEPDFARDIRPILSENCFLCHGPDDGTRATDLRLDTQAGLESRIEDQPVVTSHDPAASLLFQRITSTDPDVRMPPANSNKSLTAEQIELLRRWITAGGEYRAHWSLRSISRPEPPVVSLPEWRENPIDAFVLSRLEQEGLQPAPEAERFRLLRRVTLDLTGLPPTLEELDAFLADDSPHAYERVVDRLLASPAYGERMAWDWLDAARYADTNGYQGDNERTMWPWRDWVVAAFNRNQPFDDFTVEQLAGDLLPDATFEQRLATGFCRNHPINGEGGRIAEENRIDYVMDMSETMGTVWLGLTVGCCRCHDHKFDPLTQRDYFSLFAFFNQTPVTGGGGNARTPPVLAVYTESQRQELDQLGTELAAVQSQLSARADALRDEQVAWESQRLVELESQQWQPLIPAEAFADRTRTEILPDGSVLAKGDNPDNDAYRITAPLPAGRLAAIRLEALRHESHTQNSLSRADSGNFVLTNLRVELHLPHSGEATEPVVQPLLLSTASATFEQNGHAAATAIDGDQQTGWAVWDGKVVDREHAAVFVLAQPVDVPLDATVKVELRHDSQHAKHNIGRPRLSVSANPAAAVVGDNALLLTLRTSRDARNKEQSQAIRQAFLSADSEYDALNTAKQQLLQRRKKIDDLAPQVMVMADQQEPRPTYLLERGLYNLPGEKVTPAVPASLPALPVDAPRNRLGLARWLVSAEHPLTARVTVNRLWQQLFGIGLVQTPEDFGAQGEFPPQAELLDWLADDFRTHDWDVQRLLRQIVTSRTYRQSSRVIPALYERDPQNRLLARGPRFRLPAWMLRDQALAASGLLVPTLSGPPVNGYQPPGIWEDATFGKKTYTQDHGDALYRRSLYTFWRRIIGPTMFFDNASRQVCTVKVLRTNTPLHALLTLNDVTYIEASRVLAERTCLSETTESGRLPAIFRRVLSRPPTPAESDVLLAGLARTREQFDDDVAAADQLLSVGEFPRNATLDPVDHAAWTALCLAVLNLDEAVTKE